MINLLCNEIHCKKKPPKGGFLFWAQQRLPRIFSLFFILICFVRLSSALADTNLELLRSVVVEHVKLQHGNRLPSPTIKIFPLSLAKLSNCTAMEAFTPQGATLVGRSYVGVRCLGPANWHFLVGVEFAIFGPFLVSARPLQKGDVLKVDDLTVQTGDVTKLPVGYLMELTQGLGKTLKLSLAPGLVLRKEMLQNPLVIKQGEVVKVLTMGDGFVVSAEGRALGNAEEDSVVLVRMTNGQVLRGKAKISGIVEINN